jgi:hypothetical protein
MATCDLEEGRWYAEASTRTKPTTPTLVTKFSTSQKRHPSSVRTRHEASLATQRDARLRAERNRRNTFIGGGVALVALVGSISVWAMQPTPSGHGDIQEFPIQGRTHIQRGQSHPAYNSTPPTSGWHYADQVASPGVHAEAIPNEVQVHNLEHGEIMVQYDCPSGCAETVSALERIVKSYPKKVLLAPYPGMGRPIALTSWGRLMYLDTPDEATIRAFVKAYKDKGPEFFPDEPMATP